MNVEGGISKGEKPSGSQSISRRSVLLALGSAALGLGSGCDYRIVVERVVTATPSSTDIHRQEAVAVPATKIPDASPIPTVTLARQSTAVPTSTARLAATETRVAPAVIPSPTEVKPTNTAVPPKPTFDATPGRVLYEADWSQGKPNGWLGGEDWHFGDNILLNTGQGDVQKPLLAPFKTPVDNYSVEAEIRLVNRVGFAYSGAGVFLRKDSSKQPGYLGGFWTNENQAIIGARAGFQRITPVKGVSFDPKNNWHKYRLEAESNHLKLMIDDGVVIDIQDNNYLAGREVGLWSDNAPVEIRGFNVKLNK